ncbi:MAG: hypothetical protein ACT4P0_07310 [Panacagrimonas sp.]
MTIKYSSLGTHLQLNEIVIAGSHDAGITGGGESAQTQDLDILRQAQAGVRFFDIRIGARAVGNQVQLTSYHSPKTVSKTKTAISMDVGQALKVKTDKRFLWAGTWGQELTNILADAKDFVGSADGSDEFLILKFDKCSNWPLIAESARNILGNCIYTGHGNLNTMTLGDPTLRGKVVVAFMTKGYESLPGQGAKYGITPIRNLFNSGAYDANFDGIQYWGKGGTTAANNKSFDGKIQENIEKQSKRLRQAATGAEGKKGNFITKPFKKKVTLCGTASPQALGMMYWTTTGVSKSIRQRNTEMWLPANVGGLETIWRSGFDDYVAIALPQNVNYYEYSSGGVLKLFMPNIVMIDFANDTRCEHIFNLNTLAATKIVDACRQLGV